MQAALVAAAAARFGPAVRRWGAPAWAACVVAVVLLKWLGHRSLLRHLQAACSAQQKQLAELKKEAGQQQQKQQIVELQEQLATARAEAAQQALLAADAKAGVEERVRAAVKDAKAAKDKKWRDACNRAKDRLFDEVRRCRYGEERAWARVAELDPEDVHLREWHRNRENGLHFIIVPAALPVVVSPAGEAPSWAVSSLRRKPQADAERIAGHLRAAERGLGFELEPVAHMEVLRRQLFAAGQKKKRAQAPQETPPQHWPQAFPPLPVLVMQPALPTAGLQPLLQPQPPQLPPPQLAVPSVLPPPPQACGQLHYEDGLERDPEQQQQQQQQSYLHQQCYENGQELYPQQQQQQQQQSPQSYVHRQQHLQQHHHNFYHHHQQQCQPQQVYEHCHQHDHHQYPDHYHN
eukprot:TRINITY_DN13620_c0_g1_i2.p1 TRINITY_DN13620_c0_g1~~TRINITY_DN13620_c0_g1_i2.p1  ORF type:complete len:406 (+),score=150.25 TRINITY_DN13620_c0_g1_i2:86-1303(+)